MKIKDIILVVLILMVVSMGGYLVYDKVLREDDIITDDNKYVTEDGNVVDNKDNVNDNNQGVTYVDINDYKMADGTYGIIKSVVVEDWQKKWKFYLKLSWDGKVYIHDSDDNIKGVISNLDNVIDIVEYSNSPLDIHNFYFLTKDGYVYNYKGSDLLVDKYLSTKIENVSNVDRIILLNFCGEQACGWQWLAITNDEKYIYLSSGSV